MIRPLSILLIFLVLMAASCEDKQTSSKNNAKTPANTALETDTTQTETKDTAETETKKEEPEDKETGNQEENGMDIDFPIAQEELIPTLTEFGSENPEKHIRIKTEYGDIEVTLFENTPLHRANFIMLAKEGYFDHTFFYRVSPNFVIQGGNSDNSVTSEHRREIGSYLIPSEFEAGHKHTRGAFSAAKYSEQNVSKASSPFEFFIVINPEGAHHLNNDHTVFGRVTKGMDVVDQIAEVEIGQSEWPIDNIDMEVEIID